MIQRGTFGDSMALMIMARKTKEPKSKGSYTVPSGRGTVGLLDLSSALFGRVIRARASVHSRLERYYRRIDADIFGRAYLAQSNRPTSSMEISAHSKVEGSECHCCKIVE